MINQPWFLLFFPVYTWTLFPGCLILPPFPIGMGFFVFILLGVHQVSVSVGWCLFICFGKCSVSLSLLILFCPVSFLNLTLLFSLAPSFSDCWEIFFAFQSHPRFSLPCVFALILWPSFRKNTLIFCEDSECHRGVYLMLLALPSSFRGQLPPTRLVESCCFRAFSAFLPCS